ncbi:MAG: hypothetical protein RBR06_06920 [Desulfuromonadaceae bacterium]|jgi:3-hydroxyacyl-[acyl-carrier-protein] dehydratase|nr:hypothetical protein [Desulfuromonas sp.]MDY0212721.1 hypothetical protein [Desulfuromonadaceae bacterium]
MNTIRTEIEQAALGAAEISPSAIEESGHAQRSFRFAPEFTGFSGHFPDFPVLPAMLQTLLAQMLATQALPPEARFSGVVKSKFIRQIGPEEDVSVEIVWHRRGAQWRCSTTMMTQGQRAASMLLVFVAEANQDG